MGFRYRVVSVRSGQIMRRGGSASSCPRRDDRDSDWGEAASRIDTIGGGAIISTGSAATVPKDTTLLRQAYLKKATPRSDALQPTSDTRIPGGGFDDRAGKTLTWNADNSLVGMVGPDNVTEGYGYDTEGQRVTRQRAIPQPNGVTTVYVGGIWEEDAPSGTTRSLYQFNGKVVAQRAVTGSTATVTYLHGDHLGSVSASTDSASVLIAQQRYKPYGEVRQGVGTLPTKRGFTGQYQDDTGFYYYNARYYDPGLARFASADSIVPGAASGKGGAAATLGYDEKTRLTAADDRLPRTALRHGGESGERLHAAERLPVPVVRRGQAAGRRGEVAVGAGQPAGAQPLQLRPQQPPALHRPDRARLA